MVRLNHKKKKHVWKGGGIKKKTQEIKSTTSHERKAYFRACGSRNRESPLDHLAFFIVSLPHQNSLFRSNKVSGGNNVNAALWSAWWATDVRTITSSFTSNRNSFSSAFMMSRRTLDYSRAGKENRPNAFVTCRDGRTSLISEVNLHPSHCLARISPRVCDVIAV